MVAPIKEKKVAELRERFKQSRGAILSDYRGLTVAEITQLRRNLKTNQSEMQVVKNSLVRRAVRETAFADLESDFNGPTAVTFCEGEITDSAKELSRFASAHPVLEIRCGLFEGKKLEAPDLDRIAKLPPREVLLGQLFGNMQAPMSGLVRTLQGVLANFVMTLSAVREKKSGSG